METDGVPDGDAEIMSQSVVLKVGGDSAHLSR